MGEILEPKMMLEKWLDAAERGDTAFVVEQLQRGMDVNAGHRLTNTTALIKAVWGCQIDMIRLLLDHGADLSLEDSYGFTALTTAVIRSRSWPGDYWRIPEPDRRPLDILLAAGARYRLREAVLLNDVELARVRLDEGDDVDTGEGTYHGPVLKIAAELGYLEIVDLLLDCGANTEATDDLGQRALLSATRYGRTEVIRRLLDRGADINAVDWSGHSALLNSVVANDSNSFDLLLSRGARRGIFDAFALNDIPLLEDLLDQELRGDPDVDRLSDGGVRLAMLAAGRGNLAIVRLLLDRGAVHFQEWDDHTLLAEAARHGHLEVAQLLIDRGADLHAVGRDGLTPLAWAAREGRHEVAAMLRRAGAVR